MKRKNATYTLLPNVPTSKKHRGNRLGKKFFIGMFGNVLVYDFVPEYEALHFQI